MKYLLFFFLCLPALADTAFLNQCSTRVTDLREAQGDLSCPTYKQDCLSGTDHTPTAIICDGSPCAEYVTTVFGNGLLCDYKNRCETWVGYQKHRWNSKLYSYSIWRKLGM